MTQLKRREERGLAAIEVLTALLLRQRGEGPIAGIYDAADIQWWWKDEWKDGASRTAVRTWIWSDENGADESGADVAWMRVTETASPDPGKSETVADAGWLESHREASLTAILDALATLPASPAHPVSTVTDERDGELSDRLASLGFGRVPADDFVQTWQQPETPPAAPMLPSGFRFDDDRFRIAGVPHHLSERNGPRVAECLREMSLYRPDLDLCIRDDQGTVAAYCLCWLDAINNAGMFEPVRTEDGYQRRGLGQALMAEGIRRLMAEGATTIRVAHEADNPASATLYRRSGFVHAARNLAWRRN